MSADPIKIAKFGGSSLADAGQFRKVAAIIHADPARRYIIPSAPGKRFPDDTKVTDLLYRCYDLATRGQDMDSAFSQIENRYTEIIRELGVELSLERDFREIRNAFLHRAGRDYAASRGEYLNGKILAAYLGFDFIDAAEVVFFRENGQLDAEHTNTVLSERLFRHRYAVIPGFYGIMPNDTIRTFSRGGSDITGAIVARAVQADLYENWTDVSGFMMADPRIIDNPCAIDTITYSELRELSYMGATVLHEDAIFPVRLAGIPINIRNTNDPDAKGTMIVARAEEASDRAQVITGIAGKCGFSVITIEKDMMNAELGFGRRVLEVLEKEHISFEHLPSGIDTMSIVIASDTLKDLRDRLIHELCSAVNPDSIYIEDGMALIAVVGRGMIRTKGTAVRIFRAISDSNVNIRMIDQGSSELNIIIGVDQKDYQTAIRSIYDAFVK